MNREEIIKIPDEISPLVSNNEKNPVQFNEKSPVRSIEKSLIRLLFELVAFYYTFILTFYLEEYAALYGQEILLSIRNNYFYPLIKYHFVSIFLVGVVPYIFLHFMSVSKDIYPTLKSSSRLAWFILPFHSFISFAGVPIVSYSVVGPLFYLYHRFCETSYVAYLTENLVVIGYVIAYAFCYKHWFNFFVSGYNVHLDIFTMCKFVSQQLNRPRGVEV